MGPTLGHLAHFRAQKLVCVLSRITEGADGQLWMPDPEGLRRYQDGRCVLHHIEQVEKTALTESCFPFVRFGRDRVLAMVPDRIIEYDAAGHRSNTLKMTVDAGLLQFTGMASGPDGRSPDHRAHGDREVARHHKLENGPFSSLRRLDCRTSSFRSPAKPASCS